MSSALAEPNAIDQLEASLAGLPAAVMPVTHRFTPGLYIREIFIPKDTLLTSMEHKTEHPFVISKGRIGVRSGTEETIYEAPYTGITKPGTRRVLYAFEDTIWTTFHPTKETDVEKIAAEILEPHANPLLPDGVGNQWRNELPKIKEP